MYKSLLQVLCQQRKWALPEYTSTRLGPDHNPRFRASVIVSGASFDAPGLSNSSKEAQNKAAQVAYEHFLANPPASPAPSQFLVPPPASSGESQISYKSQLQNYVQKRNIDQPIYTSVREGSHHAIRFKAAVLVDGETFQSLKFFKSLKEAEHDAGRVALMSLPPEESQQEEQGFYKNLLQELAQKECLLLPKYITLREGACHKPYFSSTVVIEGESFQGDLAKTKKQAEMNAAKVAYYKLKERESSRSSSVLNSLSQMKIEHKPISIISSVPDVVKNTQKVGSISSPGSGAKIEQVEDHEAGESSRLSSVLNSLSQMKIENKPISIIESPDVIKNIQKVGSFASPGSGANIEQVEDHSADDHIPNIRSQLKGDNSSYNDQLPTNLHKPDPVIRIMEEDILAQHTSVEKGNTLSSAPFGGLGHSIATPNSEFSNGGGECSLLCKRVQVYPRKPDLVLPKGASLLPFSDDVWVAVTLDFANGGDGVAV